jgi:hypothetical protein
MPRAGGHPLHVARANDPAFTRGVTMFNFTGIDDGDGFKSAMRMFADAAFAASRREVCGPAVQQQEGAQRLAVRLIREH